VTPRDDRCCPEDLAREIGDGEALWRLLGRAAPQRPDAALVDAALREVRRAIATERAGPGDLDEGLDAREAAQLWQLLGEREPAAPSAAALSCARRSVYDEMRRDRRRAWWRWGSIPPR